jgi:hypothetical protein
MSLKLRALNRVAWMSSFDSLYSRRTPRADDLLVASNTGCVTAKLYFQLSSRDGCVRSLLPRCKSRSYHSDQLLRPIRATNRAVLTSFAHMFRSSGARIDDKRSRVPGLSKFVQECVTGSRVWRTSHVRDDQVVGSPHDLLECVLRRSADVNLNTECFKRLPLEDIVAGPVIYPQDPRAV